MTDTLNQLREEFSSPCPTLAEVMPKYFPHITSEAWLIRKIRAGDIALRITKHQRTRKSPYRVYLHDLAEYIDANDPRNQPAADQAA